MSGKDLNWSKFWWADWRNDPALQTCSLAARGLWMEMLALMFQSERRGYLLVAGRNPSNVMLARLAGATENEVENLLAELENAGVFRRDRHNCIWNKRMVHDERDRKAAQKNGEKGAAVRYGNQKEKSAPLKGRGKTPPKGTPSENRQPPPLLRGRGREEERGCPSDINPLSSSMPLTPAKPGAPDAVPSSPRAAPAADAGPPTPPPSCHPAVRRQHSPEFMRQCMVACWRDRGSFPPDYDGPEPTPAEIAALPPGMDLRL